MDWELVTPMAMGMGVAFIGGWWTHRSSKASAEASRVAAEKQREATKEANAATLYGALTDGQRVELRRLYERVESLEEDREKAREANRIHMKWDRELIRKLKAALPDDDFPEPPPLEI